MYRQTFVEIDVHKLEHNLSEIRKNLTPDQFFCPMIKSNAYGHGDVPFARFLSGRGVKTFGVALVEEALRLRHSGLEEEQILVFGPFGKDGAEAIVGERLTPVIKKWSELYALKKYLEPTSSYPVHLKFNTGMNRLGFSPEDVPQLIKFLKEDQTFKLRALCTHFLNGDDFLDRDGYSQKQLESFQKIEDEFSCFPGLFSHIFNSSSFSSSLTDANGRKYGVRTGLSVYGVGGGSMDLKPAMRLCTEVVALQKVKKGEVVSYGGIWRAEEDSVIGVLPIGYADGYSLHFSNKGWVSLGGVRLPVIGAVCMDYTLINLTNKLPNPLGCEGEEVIIFGDESKGEISVSEAAGFINTIPYELMTSIGRRVPWKYVGE